MESINRLEFMEAFLHGSRDTPTLSFFFFFFCLFCFGLSCIIIHLRIPSEWVWMCVLQLWGVVSTCIYTFLAFYILIKAGVCIGALAGVVTGVHMHIHILAFYILVKAACCVSRCCLSIPSHTCVLDWITSMHIHQHVDTNGCLWISA